MITFSKKLKVIFSTWFVGTFVGAYLISMGMDKNLTIVLALTVFSLSYYYFFLCDKNISDLIDSIKYQVTAWNIRSNRFNINLSRETFANNFINNKESQRDAEFSFGKTSSYETYISNIEINLDSLERLDVNPHESKKGAIFALQNGDSNEADKFLFLIQKNLTNDIKLRAEVAHIRGKVKQNDADYWGALDCYEQAIKLYPNNTAYLNEASALCYRNPNLLKKALGYMMLALKIVMKDEQNESTNVALYNNNLGMILRAMGNSKEALIHSSIAVTICKEGSEESIGYLRNHGLILYDLRRQPEALFYLDKSWKISIQEFGLMNEKTQEISEIISTIQQNKRLSLIIF